MCTIWFYNHTSRRGAFCRKLVYVVVFDGYPILRWGSLIVTVPVSWHGCQLEQWLLVEGAVKRCARSWVATLGAIYLSAILFILYHTLMTPWFDKCVVRRILTHMGVVSVKYAGNLLKESCATEILSDSVAIVTSSSSRLPLSIEMYVAKTIYEMWKENFRKGSIFETPVRIKAFKYL